MNDEERITQLLLIRHGQSFFNRDGQEAGVVFTGLPLHASLRSS